MIDPLERWRAVRREARLRGAAHLRRRAVHPGPRRARGVRRRDRRRADRRPRQRPAGRPLRAARDPRRELPARAAHRGEGRRVRGAEDRRLRRRAGPSRRRARTHAAIEQTVGQVLDAGAMPIISAATTRSPSRTSALAPRKHGPVGLIHFDTHTDTGTEVFGVEVSHGTPMYRLVEQGHVDPRATPRSACAATGRARKSSRGRPSRASRAFMHDVRELGIERSSGARSRSWATGRSSSRSTSTCSTPPSRPARARPSRRHDLRRAALGLPRDRAEVELVGADVVEVIPTAVGSADITALVADRIVREILTGIALRRRG